MSIADAALNSMLTSRGMNFSKCAWLSKTRTLKTPSLIAAVPLLVKLKMYGDSMSHGESWLGEHQFVPTGTVKVPIVCSEDCAVSNRPVPSVLAVMVNGLICRSYLRSGQSRCFRRCSISRFLFVQEHAEQRCSLQRRSSRFWPRPWIGWRGPS